MGTVSLVDKETARHGTARIVATVVLTRGNVMNETGGHGIRALGELPPCSP
jgi:hypothetical protein